MLGDGVSCSSKLTNTDQEIINRWEEYGKSIGLVMTEKSEKITHALVYEHGKEPRKKDGTMVKNPFKKLLEDYDLIKNKHIPQSYLESNTEDRM